MKRECVASVPARIHLAGNPSDGYGGAVLSTIVPRLRATVTARESRAFRISGPERSWASIEELSDDTDRHGHEGGDRLVTAALVSLDRHLPDDPGRPALELDWSTSIPRSVGLGGSSAIVIATMRSALDCWGLEVSKRDLAEAALAAETELLGIPAGLADRVVQVWEATTLTDCRAGTTVTAVPANGEFPALVLWNRDAAAPSGWYHRELRARFDDGEPEVVATMARLAALADDAAQALLTGDRVRFARALDESLSARCSMGELPKAALAPVEAMRSAGAAVNFAGSGGALVVVGDVDVPAGWSHLQVTPA